MPEDQFSKKAMDEQSRMGQVNPVTHRDLHELLKTGGQDKAYSEGGKAIKEEINSYADRKDSSISRQMTFGEKLVGLSFNPSNDDKVARAKKLCAELMDLVNEEKKNRESTQLENILYNHTVGEILNAQMNVVKLLTLKY